MGTGRVCAAANLPGIIGSVRSSSHLHGAVLRPGTVFCLQPLARFDDARVVWTWLFFMCTKNMCIEMSIVGQAILQNNLFPLHTVANSLGLPVPFQGSVKCLHRYALRHFSREFDKRIRLAYGRVVGLSSVRSLRGLNGGRARGYHCP